MGRLVDVQLIARVKAAMKQAGLSQADVAREAGVAPSYISGVLAGRVNPSSRIIEAVERLSGQSVAIAQPRGASRSPDAVEDLQQAMAELERAVAGVSHPLVSLALQLVATGHEKLIFQAMGYLEAQLERADVLQPTARSA